MKEFEGLYKQLKKECKTWKTEDEVRVGWVSALTKTLNITFGVERDRNDASYNQVIIEFKNKGLFKASTTSTAFKNAVYDRLDKYITRKSKKEGLLKSEYTGIAIDGEHISFVHFRNNKIKHGPLMPLDYSSVSMVAIACRNSENRAITSENLISDFGHKSQAGSQMMQALSTLLVESLTAKKVNKIKMLYEEWKTLFGQVAGLSKLQKISIEKTVGFSISMDDSERIPCMLFIIHTYNSFLIKLLAAEIVSEHDLTSFPNFAQEAATLDNVELIEFLSTQIEKSQIFQTAGINGFVEEVIFSWYVDAYKTSKNKVQLTDSIKDLLIQISLYRTDTLDAARSTDVLKKVYQGLVPDALRKSLGEYYTPDWLVDYTLDITNTKDWLETRALDPTCGSGSFLIRLIQQIRKAAKTKKMSQKDTLLHITNNVWGFDLNPLAVQTARVNFLISISDLLEANKGLEIELPVLLADAVYSPAQNPDNDEDIIEYRIGSAEADLLITLPSTLAFDRRRLDNVFDVMGNSVEDELSYELVEKKLLRLKYLSNKEAKEWKAPLSQTYNRVVALHKKNWNGIWFRIVRNFFWSSTAGEFDLVAGNPPWVRWSNLPVNYREKIKPTCLQYEIFSETPHHGGNELDISGMITYTVADKWLKENGKLAFLITQTHFQSPSSSGFRRFSINEDYNLSPIRVDDLKFLKPFPDAANKTSIGIFKKQKNKTKYPIPYRVWKSKEKFTRAIPLKLPLQDVKQRVSIELLEANPVDKDYSPWAILPKGEFKKLSSIQGQSQWVKGRKGITCDLNGIYFVNILNQNETNGLVQIETRPEAGKTDLGPKRKFWIEPDLLHPLIKGASDFSDFSINPKKNLYALIPNKGITKKYYEEAEEIVETDLKNTYKYFKSYQKLLKDRSTYRGRMPNAPFYAIYNVGEYTFSPYKVIWAEQSGKFCSAVSSHFESTFIGKKTYVPDHKIFFVDFKKPKPAYFLCGLLNSIAVKNYINSHTISIQVGNIFKHLNLPEFDEDDKIHQEVSKLSQKAHKVKTEKTKASIIEKLNNLIEKVLFNE